MKNKYNIKKFGGFMNEKIAKLVYDYSMNEKNADLDFLYKIVEYYQEELKKNDLIKEIRIEKIKGSYGFYRIDDNTISVDLKTLKKYTSPIGYNLEIAISMLHELDHARYYNKLFDDNIEKFFSDIKVCLSVSCSKNKYIPNIQKFLVQKYTLYLEKYNQNFYKKNYYYCPHERIAFYNSGKSIIEIIMLLQNKITNESDKKYLSNIMHATETFNYFKRIKGYKKGQIITNSPSFDYYINFYKKIGINDFESIFENSIYYQSYLNNTLQNNYSFEDRVKYGLPLYNDEYNELIGMLKDKSKTLIKRLI